MDGQGGELIVPADAGDGPAGVTARWVAELGLADRLEKNWRSRAQDVNARYRDEAKDASQDGRFSNSNRYNILYSNIQTICPALYNQSPKPDVRRRYRDRDPAGAEVSEVLERSLSFTMDDGNFDRYMRLAVKDMQLCGRGVTRVRYDPVFGEEDDGEGNKYDELKAESVKFEHVNWADFRHGPGRTWEEVEWVAFRHLLNRQSLREKFGEEITDEIELDYSPADMDDAGDPVTDTFKRATIWEVWCKYEKTVTFISKNLKERPIKVEDDPLGLHDFFPVPRPLYATENTDSLVPVEPFRFYKDQADELDGITKRISGVISACRVRGIYDSTITEMSNLMDANENMMVPAQDVLPLMQSGGIDKAIWMWPIEKIAGVLNQLYVQREQIKSAIYEITGIADIMRGSSSSSETLGAQQLKVQFGTMRLDDMGRDVQRYARDLIRIAGEIIAEQFNPDSIAMMTDVRLPSPERKLQAQAEAQAMAAQGQPLPPQLKDVLEKPTWEECVEILRDDKQRTFRVDIETNSTVSGDQVADQRAMTELLQGVSTFISNAGPAVAAGYLPLEAAKSMLMSAVRRFKMGREVEDALDLIGEQEGQAAESEGQAEGGMDMDMQMQHQAIAQKAEETAQRLKLEQDKLFLEQQGKQADLAIKEKELALMDREMALKEIEAAKPELDKGLKFQAEMEMQRERMQFEAAEADKHRQVDLAKTIMAEFSGPDVTLTDPGQAISRAAEIMDRIHQVLGAVQSVGGAPLAETTIMVASDEPGEGVIG
jgi:hypothetical protein|tara:strand:- start:1593 stop:3902 length:2310 start_codon:yes stop_codon:yes gene_type:complete